jgi:hypothetical protein
MENPYEPPKTRMATKPSKLNRYLYAIGVTILATIVVLTLMVGSVLLKQFLFNLIPVGP